MGNDELCTTEILKHKQNNEFKFAYVFVSTLELELSIYKLSYELSLGNLYKLSFKIF